MDAVEQLSPGIEKTVATNLLKKMEAQKEVIDDKDNTGELAIIKLLSIEEKALRENLEMLVEADKDLCHPRELQVDHRDPARQEFAIYRQQLQDRKTLLQSILTNYHAYIDVTQEIYEAECQMSSETEQSVTNSVMSVFLPVNPEGTFAYKLEKQQLENDIQKALTNLLDNKKSLAADIQRYKWQRLCHLVEICNLQWSRLP